MEPDTRLARHWHYEDFVREQNPKFPSCTLKRFFGMLWSAVPLLNEWHEMHEEAFDQFMAYKAFVPVCGAIILNDACDKVNGLQEGGNLD
jgi:mRNA-decapping enzyme subunit 2